MGDSCFNPGMKSVTAAVGKKLNVYSTCKPTGDNVLMDTINGFLMNMDKSVDEFAKRVKADPKLKGGFNAMGLNQGNNLIRGYIQKYNDPPVHGYMSICGINGGVAGFPQCAPGKGPIGMLCLAFNEVLGDLAYIGLIQDILFQANYYRDPEQLNGTMYKANAQLAQWNGEGNAINATDKLNWNKTQRLVWVRGTRTRWSSRMRESSGARSLPATKEPDRGADAHDEVVLGGSVRAAHRRPRGQEQL